MNGIMGFVQVVNGGFFQWWQVCKLLSVIIFQMKFNVLFFANTDQDIANF